MMERNLKRSAVSFDAAAHIYMLDGVELKGVTPIVKWMYPETYADIPEDVLMRAAEHGKSVHLDCQMIDAGLPCDSREAVAYKRMKDERDMETWANEWLVDDGRIASSIDVVFTDGSIADIKTTSQIHVPNVTLQLSIYAMLLEDMNDWMSVPRLWVIWLPRERYGEPRWMELQRIPKEVCREIVDSYLKGESPDGVRALVDGQMMPERMEMPLPTEWYDAEAEVIRLELEVKRMKARSEELREGLMRMMEESGIKKYDSERMSITYQEPYEQERCDTAKVKKLYPEIYRECVKKTQVKSTIKIKIK